jgi:HAD superfamily hydrolase (TIGR01450 family)
MIVARRIATEANHNSVAIIALARMPLSPLLTRYDHVLLDLDGCVWLGDECTPRAPEAISALRAAGKSIAFLTNDARLAPEEYVRRLWSLGVQAALEEVITAGSAIQHVLAEREPPKAAYVIGSDAIYRHVEDAGCPVVNYTDRAGSADIVVVAAYDKFQLAELRAAIQSVLAGAEILAANRDRTFPTSDGLWPATGSLVAALEYATERTARTIGKPDPQMFETALDRLGPGRALVVGDRLDSDLAGAAAAGLDGAIVLTGVSSREQAQDATDPAPVAVADNLFSLVVSR